MKTPEICLITRGWSYHGKYSGFELLGQYLPNCKMAPEIPLHPGISRRIARFSRHENYSSHSVHRELGALAWCVRHQPKLIHCLYGDMDFHYLGYFRFLFPRTKLLATFHHPEPELSKRLGKCGYGFLQKLDAITCVGQNQIPFMQRIAPAARAYWLPHGIDTNFFSPDRAVPRRPNRIFVTGVSHRDFETLNAALCLICKNDPETEIHVSLEPEFRHRLELRERVKLLENKLTDEQLLQHYREATCTLLCLRDCTASNTLLEAIATGCPLVVSDVGGVRNYVSPAEALLVSQGDSEGFAQAAISILRNSTLQAELSENSRRKAMEFTWEKIATRASQIYQELIDGIPVTVSDSNSERTSPAFQEK